jgi:hypothetical protein
MNRNKSNESHSRRIPGQRIHELAQGREIPQEAPRVLVGDDDVGGVEAEAAVRLGNGLALSRNIKTKE